MRTNSVLLIFFAACFLFCRPSAAQNPPVSAADAETAAASWKILSAGVHDKSVTRRADATVALGSLGIRTEVVRLVEAGLADPHPRIREISAATLGSMRSRTSIPKLKPLLQDKSDRVRFTAARALWEMGDTSGRDLFITILSGESENRMKTAVSGQIKDATSTLTNPKELASIGFDQGASALLGPFALALTLGRRMAEDRSAPVRALCADLLTKDSNPDSLRELEDALLDKSWAVRAAAAKALGIAGHIHSVPKLQPLLEDKNSSVRFMAAASIVRITQYRIPPAPATLAPAASSTPPKKSDSPVAPAAPKAAAPPPKKPPSD
jgi:HEAT repeat protein